MAAVTEKARSANTEELVEEAKSGNEQSFKQVYQTYVARVFSLCLRILADTQKAEDVTQQIFIRIWSNLDSFRFESSFETWLYRVSFNQIFNELKRDRQVAASQEIQDYVARLPTETRADLRIDLERAIARLPQQARIVFVLHDVEGFKHGEIAEGMGLAMGTCKSQLFRARRLLREALEK